MEDTNVLGLSFNVSYHLSGDVVRITDADDRGN